MISFDDLVLPETIKKALGTLAFKTPTPIQNEAIPLIQNDKDLIACAQTGTGKTLAFALPLAVKVLEDSKSRALILAPTRELVNQIAQVFDQLLQYAGKIQGAILIGGAAMGRQIRELQHNPSIVIATPGRLLDHMQRRTIDLSQFNIVVLDEADRMFDMGFAEPVDKILNSLAAKRQSLLFSATLSKEVVALSRKYLKDPERVSVGAVEKPIAKIKQDSISVNGPDKNEALLKEIKTRGEGQRIVFVRTKIRADRLAKFLKTNAVKVSAIHGGRTQAQREDALSRFRNGEIAILVATDVASRGLDIPEIETVFNFDLPEKYEDYVHRIGRTARAGAEGEAISFVTPEEQRHWAYLMSGGKGTSKLSRGGGSSQGRSRRPWGAGGNSRPRRDSSRRSSSQRSSSQQDSRGFRSGGDGRGGSSSAASRHSPKRSPEGRSAYVRFIDATKRIVRSKSVAQG